MPFIIRHIWSSLRVRTERSWQVLILGQRSVPNINRFPLTFTLSIQTQILSHHQISQNHVLSTFYAASILNMKQHLLAYSPILGFISIVNPFCSERSPLPPLTASGYSSLLCPSFAELHPGVLFPHLTFLL